ncbi:MAG TPA: hypothetical protein VFX49_15325 [Chloroflexota bacterium]|nr:hypothetical protein [Chloroflexota bacterium]
MAQTPGQTPGTNLAHATLGQLAAACSEETARFQRGEPARTDSCWEILRRAVVEREHAAWEAIHTQYRGLVIAWIRQHSASASAREAEDYFLNRVFERFWSAIGPDRFSQFTDLPAILKYLKMCVHSVLMDDVRARRAAEIESLELPGVRERVDAAASAGHGGHGGDGGPEQITLGGMASDELWQVIAQELPDETERELVYWSFVLDLKPSEIHSRSPQRYPTVADVYRVKRNVLERLRRSPRLRQLQQLAS